MAMRDFSTSSNEAGAEADEFSARVGGNTAAKPSTWPDAVATARFANHELRCTEPGAMVESPPARMPITEKSRPQNSPRSFFSSSPPLSPQNSHREHETAHSIIPS